MVERMITFAKRGDLAARRHVARFVHGDDVVRKLFDTVAPWYAERQGGYTRIVRIGRRLGDAGETALLELVKSPELKERLRQEAEEKAKAERAAKGTAKKEGKAAKGGEGGDAPAKKERAPKAPRTDGPGMKAAKKTITPKHTARGRQRGKSGD